MMFRLIILAVLTLGVVGAAVLFEESKPQQQSQPASEPSQDAFKNFKIPH